MLRSEVDVGGLAPEPAAPALGDGTEQRRAFLSTLPPPRGERRLAVAVIALSALAFAAAIPFAKLKLTPVPAFIPAYEAALVVSDIITALLLLGQFAQLRSRALLVLAAGYLFDALMIIPHALTFPGVFAPTGLLHAGSQSTAWLYMFWHGGFPLFVMAYTALASRGENAAPRHGAAVPALVATAGIAGLAAALTLLATAGHDLLPVLLVDNSYAPALLGVVSIVWLLSLAALVRLWQRQARSVLDLWLMVVMTAWLFDVALSAVLNGGRFDLGFYAGRAYGLLAANFVLAVLLLETSGLHGRLARTTVRLEHQARQLREDVRERINMQRQTEAQLRQAQKMEAIGNLTGGMAHDFNNLLGIIIGNLDALCERKAGDSAVDELAGEALDAALRGAELTRRLLAFARRQPLQPRRIEVNALVAGIAKLLGRVLGESVAVTLDLAPAPWPVVADPAQLEAALTNLATNARDAMPKGGKLSIATANRTLDADYAAQHADVRAGDYVMIEVSDTGAGMVPEVAARIFEPFFTTKGQGKGSGLGLAMVYGYMRQSGGHINVYSEPGIGTTFRLYLPRTAAETAATLAPAPAPAAGGRGETVLAVEDNAALRRVVMRQLQGLGYRALEAEDTETALAVLARERVDLLFTDIVLGSGSGVDLARSATARRPELRVVFTSGFPDARLNSEAGDAIPARLLNKPYRKEDLAKALREALEE